MESRRPAFACIRSRVRAERGLRLPSTPERISACEFARLANFAHVHERTGTCFVQIFLEISSIRLGVGRGAGIPPVADALGFILAQQLQFDGAEHRMFLMFPPLFPLP